MKWRECGLFDHIFSHLNPHSGEMSHINVTTLSEDWRTKARPVHDAIMDQDGYDLCMAQRGIEEHRVARLRGLATVEPILICIWKDQTHLVVDGHHRYVARWRDGHREIPCRMLPRSIWERHLVEDIPEQLSRALLQGFSGIL